MQNISRYKKRPCRHLNNKSVELFCVFTFLIVLSSFFGNVTWAKTVNKQQAGKAAQGWLKSDLKPFKMAAQKQIHRVQTFSDADNLPLYYVVNLRPSGFVIVSADDCIEPIIAFADDGIFDPSIDNPLGALVTGDINQRMAMVRGESDSKSAKTTGWQKNRHTAKAKWDRLSNITTADEGEPLTTGLVSVSEVRVEPLIQSKWDQKNVSDSSCYNYYTPQWVWDVYPTSGHISWDPGNSNNYYCGCVATAMAQLMRFHEYPNTGIGSWPFTITVVYDAGAPDPCSETDVVYTRGGDGSGGIYKWELMELEPVVNGVNDLQRQAIGALCYDAGLAVEMQYGSGGSGTYMSYVNEAMVDTFGFNNAIQGNRTDWTDIGDGLPEMINPNLDAALPVLLGVEKQGATTGHAIVCDGYGYNSATLYHHLNMGWAGTDDAWYNLPIIQGDYADYNIVTCCIYNLFVSGGGEIISGRVTDSSDNPISQATVTATGPGSPGSVVTDANGIYAFTNLASSSAYSISVDKNGYSFQSLDVTTGLSADDEYISGNKWAIDFTGTATVPADLTGDLIVDMNDFAVFAGYWRDIDCNDSNNCGGADFEPDGDVDVNDLKVFSSYWLDGTEADVIEINDIFYSIGDEDGRVWDDGNSYGVNNVSYDSLDKWALRLGDWQQYGYRNILSFDTASLPADAEVTSAQLELTCGYLDGVSPFTGWGGNCYVDIANPSFDSVSLENSDWEAVADAVEVATFSTDPYIGQTITSTNFNVEGLGNISTEGRTQFRVYFQNSNSADGDEDFVGFYSGDNSDSAKKPKLKITYNTLNPIAEFISEAAEDGRVWAEWDDVEGWRGTGFDDDDTDWQALRLGDYLDTHSLRIILSFDTSLLPDDCVILSAKLQMTRSDITGTDPFSWGGNCYIDINSPYFGAGSGMENSDWQADANGVAIAEFSGDPGDENPMISTEFNADGLSNINKSGRTQFRVYFTIPTYSSSATDSLYFYSGETTNEDKKPKLIIQYQIN